MTEVRTMFRSKMMRLQPQRLKLSMTVMQLLTNAFQTRVPRWLIWHPILLQGQRPRSAKNQALWKSQPLWNRSRSYQIPQWVNFCTIVLLQFCTMLRMNHISGFIIHWILGEIEIQQNCNGTIDERVSEVMLLAWEERMTSEATFWVAWSQ